MKLPEYTRCDSDRGYEEILFCTEVDISDDNIDAVNTAVEKEFVIYTGNLDWRDPFTLWIWDKEVVDD